jgi:toxin-antitoxin system PIN domain toxin
MQKMLLLDVNVWIAFAISSHMHHPSAKAFFLAQGDQSCLFCRMTQQGFLRLISNPQLTIPGVQTLFQAWQTYDRLRLDKRVGFAAEPSGIETRWRSITQHHTYSPKLWNDAFLAAFSMECGFEFVTFDKGFTQFPGLRLTILT